MTSVARRLGPRHSREHGAAAVEFALVLPLFLLVVFGIITYGFVFAQELALSNAARQGARFGVVADRTCADISSEVANSATTLGMTGSGITVKITRGAGFDCTTAPADARPCAGSSSEDSVQVTAKFTSVPIVPMILVDDIELEGTGAFRCEFS